MRWMKTVGAGLCVAAGLAFGTETAGADPINAKNAEVLSINCTLLGPLTVVTNGNGQWTPGHVLGSTQVGIPYEFHISGTFTPTGGAPQSFTEDFVKRAPRHGRLDTCTFSESGSDAEGTFTFGGTVKISYTPAH